MLNQIYYSLLDHFSLFTLSQSVLDAIAPIDITPYGLQIFVDRATEKHNNFDSALKRDNVNPLTVKIHEADEERDDAFLGLKNYVQACTYRRDEGWNESAVNIQRCIERYGNKLYTFGLRQNTGALVNFLGDLKTLPLSADVTKINLTEWVNILDNCEIAFEALTKQRQDETITDLPTITNTRKPLINALKDLLNMINLQAKALDDATLNSLVLSLNNNIDEAMTSARMSQAQSEPDELEVQ